MGIKFRRPHYDYAQKARKADDIQMQQQVFSRKLGTVMVEDEREIIYIDESTFNLWQYPTRAWLAKGMGITLAETRGKSITIIGAISEDRGLVHYDLIVGSNNAETFSKFLLALKSKCPAPAVVVLDNLAVHKAKDVVAIYDRRFKELLLPPYSCTLNPIERLWSRIKTEWRKT